jgi:hypothetical protein
VVTHISTLGVTHRPNAMGSGRALWQGLAKMAVTTGTRPEESDVRRSRERVVATGTGS